MESKVNNNDNMFNVPCVVVDNLLQMATGEDIKVLLYILRCSGRDFAENEISNETGVSQEEVNKAIDFWRRARVLTANSTQPVQQAEEVKTIPENSSGQTSMKFLKFYLSASDIAEIKNNDPAMSELITVAENSLGTLNHIQISTIIKMHHYLGLKKEVIITLIEYCKEIGRTSVAYMETIAYSWYENNINTLETAQKEVEKLISEKNVYINKVKRIVLVDRISPEQENIIAKWYKLNVPLERVEEAYNTTLNRINKLSYTYMDKIITSDNDGSSDTSGTEHKKPVYKNKSSGGRRIHNDADFDVDMYK
ncbi:MAG: DnaD domain protein, partial [Ruminococcus sp.]|nr:DnaD domain protein [Ruminococcus sp.]